MITKIRINKNLLKHHSSQSKLSRHKSIKLSRSPKWSNKTKLKPIIQVKIDDLKSSSHIRRRKNNKTKQHNRRNQSLNRKVRTPMFKLKPKLKLKLKVKFRVILKLF